MPIQLAERMNSRWLPHLWALVVPIALTAIAFLIGLLLLGYGPVLLRWLFD